MIKNNHYPFVLQPLAYAYDALEPFIDTKTMHLHHDKHLVTYINNLNATLKEYPEYQNWTLEQLIYYSSLLPCSIRQTVINNAGGVYNHTLFFDSLSPNKSLHQRMPTGGLMRSIQLDYGTFDVFKAEFKKQALAVFGSGYTWLGASANGKTHIVNTANQDTILPDNLQPLMLIDVWEHAYYLKNYNVRADYIDAWFNVVDYSKADASFALIAPEFRH